MNSLNRFPIASAFFSLLSFPFFPFLFLSSSLSVRRDVRSLARRENPLNTALSPRSLLIWASSKRNGVEFISDWTDTADNPSTSISNCQLKTNYLLSRILSFTDYLLLKLNAIWLLRAFCLSDSTGLCKNDGGRIWCVWSLENRVHRPCFLIQLWWKSSGFS